MRSSIFQMVSQVLADTRQELAKTASNGGTGSSSAPAQSVTKTAASRRDVLLSDAEKVAAACDYLAGNLGLVVDTRSPKEKLASLTALHAALEKRAEDPPMNPPMDGGIAPGGPSSAMMAEPANTPGEQGAEPSGQGEASPDKVPPKSVEPSEKPTPTSASNALQTNMDSPPGEGAATTPEKIASARLHKIAELVSSGQMTKQAGLELVRRDQAHLLAKTAGIMPWLINPVGATAGQLHENKRPGYGALGGLAGHSVGAAIGSLPGVVFNSPNLTDAGAVLGGIAGNAGGGYLAAHMAGPSRKVHLDRASRADFPAKAQAAAEQEPTKQAEAGLPKMPPGPPLQRGPVIPQVIIPNHGPPMNSGLFPPMAPEHSLVPRGQPGGMRSLREAATTTARKLPVGKILGGAALLGGAAYAGHKLLSKQEPEKTALQKEAILDIAAGSIAGSRHENKRPGYGALGGLVGGALGAVPGVARRSLPLAVAGGIGGGYLGGHVAAGMAGPSAQALREREENRLIEQYQKTAGLNSNIARALIEKFAEDASNPASISAGTEPVLQSAAGANPAQSQGTAAGEQVPETKGSDPGRELISSNEAAIRATPRDAKNVAQEMQKWLTEPAMSGARDKTLEQSLNNTSQAGVKIAAAREQLQKWASLSPANKQKLAQALMKIAEGEEAPVDPSAAPEEVPPEAQMAPDPSMGQPGAAPGPMPQMPGEGESPVMSDGQGGISDAALMAAAEGVTPEELALAEAMLAHQMGGQMPEYMPPAQEEAPVQTEEEPEAPAPSA